MPSESQDNSNNNNNNNNSNRRQNHPEIWSTRIQRELLALTTDNADAESVEEVRSMIPRFVRVQSHHLDLHQGNCWIDFVMEMEETETKKTIVIRIDPSLPSNSNAAPSYPFVAPKVLVQKGADQFPAGSTIQDGQQLAMDLDWTPSLHLTDAIMNVSLKIKESILQKEPLHPLPPQPNHPVEELQKGVSRFANTFSKGASNLTKGFNFGGSGQQQKQQKQSKARSAALARKKKKNKPATPKTHPQDIKIGDEINMLEEPWADARGVYSCKAIRRPAFVAEAIEKAAQEAEQKAFKTPANMFRSFTKSARSVLEESFLMITDEKIIELKASKLNLSSATITFEIDISQLAKLKFRRHESLSLFFKRAPTDQCLYVCPDSSDAVHQIQSVLKGHGVRGKHTNATAYRAISEAMQLVQEIQTKELALKHDPTVNRVNEIMDLYRQAAERFEAAGDLRHEEVVTHLRKFLALPLTVSILDGSYQKPPSTEVSLAAKNKDGVLEGHVLEPHHHDDDDMTTDNKESDKAFAENVDNLLKEAQEDFEQFNNIETSTLETDTSSDMALADVAADLDAMMREADKELAELMKA